MSSATRLTVDPRTALLPFAAVAFALAGTALHLGAQGAQLGHFVWLAGLVVTGLPVLWRTLRSMARGHFATDIVATLAIAAAFILREPLAGLIVVIMQTGGEALERYAEGRASRAVRELEAQAPRIAHRLEGAQAVDVAVEEVRVGDQLLVRPGEMIPCDGIVTNGRSHVDTSRLTGEPLPVTAVEGIALMSGTLNGEGPLVLRATAPSRESQYARIVELVRSAEASKAPLQRLADRYAVWFTPVTLVVCAVSWFLSGDPTRALAVLVVATPCPLILATPIAIIGGVNRMAARQIIVRSGAALERLDDVRVAVFDKTGTLTVGQPRVARVIALPSHDEREVLRLAGALEQHSGHALARPVVEAAVGLDGPLPAPTAVRESPGRGVSGDVEGRAVSVGSRAFALEMLGTPALSSPADNGARMLRAYVTVDGELAGVLEYADQLRPGATEVVPALRALGVRRTVLLSGDESPNVGAVAKAAGLDEAIGELLPHEKVEWVASLASRDGHVLMVGDGTNDAPALAQADVGIALAGHGGGITAEAADIVLLVDDLGRVADALRIGKRTMRIARQSIWAGLSLSGAAMLVAAAGGIPPVIGALLQEAIDVAVILNALRASAPLRGAA
jgi:heavy metal translocating P-type ATPase